MPSAALEMAEPDLLAVPQSHFEMAAKLLIAYLISAA
jgi:hypothetical protein